MTGEHHDGVFPATTMNFFHSKVLNKDTTDFEILDDGGNVLAKVLYTFLSETGLSAQLCKKRNVTLWFMTGLIFHLEDNIRRKAIHIVLFDPRLTST